MVQSFLVPQARRPAVSLWFRGGACRRRVRPRSSALGTKWTTRCCATQSWKPPAQQPACTASEAICHTIVTTFVTLLTRLSWGFIYSFEDVWAYRERHHPYACGEQKMLVGGQRSAPQVLSRGSAGAAGFVVPGLEAGTPGGTLCQHFTDHYTSSRVEVFHGLSGDKSWILIWTRRRTSNRKRMHSPGLICQWCPLIARTGRRKPGGRMLPMPGSGLLSAFDTATGHDPSRSESPFRGSGVFHGSRPGRATPTVSPAV